MGLGAFSTLSLAYARGLRADYLALLALANGIDSRIQAEVAEEQQQIALDSIFSTVAANWFQLKSKSVTPNYAKDIWRSLEKDVLPVIGETPVQQIKARILVEALEPIKVRGALETIRRLVQRINEIMLYAVNIGLLDANQASVWLLLRLKSKTCRRCGQKNCRS
jgi:integrase